MPNYLNKILVISSILVLSITNKTFAQLDFLIDPSYCLNQIASPTIQNNSYSNVEWDFCVSSFEDESDVTFLSDVTNGGRNLGIDFIKQSGVWYGIATSWSNSSIFLLTFSNGLNNDPTEIFELGNPDNVLDQPVSIGIIERNGLVYALIQNWGSSNLVRIKFNDGINGINQSGKIIYNSYGKILSKMEIVDTSIELKTVLINSDATIEIIDFQNDIDRTIGASDVFITPPVIGVSNSREIDMVLVDGKWYGFIASYSSGTVTRVDFDSDIFTGIKGVFNTISANIFSGEKPNNIEIIANGGIYEIHVFTFEGSIYKVKLGSDITIENITSGAVKYGLDNNYAQGYALTFVRDQGDWFGFILNDINAKLYGITSSTVCPSLTTFSNLENPELSYDNSGTFPISVKGFDLDGSFEVVTKSITISPSLAPQALPQITGNCLSSPISFDGQQISGDITTWSWDFGDGLGTSNLQNDSYTYASTGEYQVRLSVTDANGCNNFIIDTVQIYEEPVPEFSFSGGTSLCKNNLVTFTNNSTGETGDIVTWNWDFNGEGASSEKDPTFTFLTAGTKNITLTSSIPGCANVIQKTLNIVDAPTTGFSFNNSCNGQTSTFTDETTGSNLTSWNWDFGDGTTSTDQNPTHTYSIPGDYNVILTVTNNTGCFTTNQQTVVNHSIPVVSFTNDLPCSTTPIRFFDKSLVENTNIVAWEWDFGDGAQSNIQHPEHFYGQTGDFTVKLKAFSQFGCVDSIETILSIAQGPEVDFEWDKSCESEITTFTDLTNSFNTQITDWAWVINGQLLTNQNPTHTFNSSGIYTVQLSVTMTNSCAQSLTQDIIIETPPKVQFAYNEACIDNGTQFYDLTDQTNDTIISREWRVNGAVFSNDSSVIEPLVPGQYTITLSVITEAGCEDSSTSDVSLIGSPIAEFSTNTIYGAAPLAISFTNNSTGGSDFLWAFGDLENSSSNNKNPSFTYSDTGKYTVTLRTSSRPDCYDETTRTIKVVEPITKASIIAVTPVVDTDKTNFLITIENNGTTLLDSKMNLVFRADYGAEVIESLNGVIYAGKTINYQPSFAIPPNSSIENLCVQLIEEVQLDRNCTSLNSPIIISAPYPNPGIGLINIDIMLETESTIDVTLFNRSGQPVKAISNLGLVGLNELIIDGQLLPQGLYIIEVEVGNEKKQFKTSIIR
jgi:PKD repeat protein